MPNGSFLFLLAVLSSCHFSSAPEVTGVYVYANPFAPQAPPLGQLTLTPTHALYQTPAGEFELAYSVDPQTVYLQTEDHTRLVLHRVHRDTLRQSLGLLGEANYVRVHD
ncbi:hypothetical protein [Hymenobacter crusticola]|uniref:Uncharacterized protein n=1 Tax=Hymenobacter crusticola TaxID=1770526 RepID=A0A243W6B9_9BACT|nr:hypothetical protein [Hymenobacter crusticola]OUJ69886.1 hypothetical protein BXP70_25815 [Hymenobacter crusticola]